MYVYTTGFITTFRIHSGWFKFRSLAFLLTANDVSFFVVRTLSGAALEIFDWGSKVRRSGDGSPLVGSRGKAPVGGLAPKSPRS